MDDTRTIQITRRLAIPLGEIAWEFATTGGPGGQHANRSNTKTTLCFDVAASPSLSDGQRARIRGVLPGRISGEGILRVTCGRHRSQSQNREECIERFRKLLGGTFQPTKPRRKTQPTRGSKERRIEAKKQRSSRKAQRGPVRDW